MSGLVIIPTYNEKENVENICRAVFELPEGFHVLIIDDGSPDGTADIVKRMMQDEFSDRLFIVERPGKLGLGTAYLTGFKWAIERKYDFIFEMDGVNVVNWPIGRVLMSYFASKYVRIVTGMNIHDTTAGFKCYRREVLETIGLDTIKLKGYGFQIEMKYTAYKCGFTIKEVPIIFINRVLGVSKMSGGIFGEALFGVMGLRLRSLFKKYPQKQNKSN